MNAGVNIGEVEVCWKECVHYEVCCGRAKELYRERRNMHSDYECKSFIPKHLITW